MRKIKPERMDYIEKGLYFRRMTKEEKVDIKKALKPAVKKFWNVIAKMIESWVKKLMDDFFASAEYKKHGNTEKALKLFFKHREKEAKP